MSGETMNNTPIKPYTMIAHLINPIFSLKNIPENIVMKNGAVKNSAVASAKVK